MFSFSNKHTIRKTVSLSYNPINICWEEFLNKPSVGSFVIIEVTVS